MHPLIQAALLALVGTAGVYDYVQRRIPNWLVALGLLTALPLNIALNSWPGLRDSLLGLGLAFLIYLPFYLLRAMGAGDLKLMMAVGALAGPKHWLGIFALTSILGGVAAIAIMTARGRQARTLSNIGLIFRRLIHLQAPASASPELDVRSSQSVKLPHGVVIAFGTLSYLLLTR